MEKEKLNEVCVINQEKLDVVGEVSTEERIDGNSKHKDGVKSVPSASNEKILQMQMEHQSINPESIFVSDGILSPSDSLEVSKLPIDAENMDAQSYLVALAKEKKKVYMKHYMKRKRLEHKIQKEAYKHLLIDGDLIAPTIKYYDKKREYMKNYMRSKRKEEQYKERKRAYMKQYMRDRRLKKSYQRFMEVIEERQEMALNNSPVKIVDINSLLINNHNPESEETPINNSPLKIDLHSLLINNRYIINEDVPLNNRPSPSKNNSPVKIVDINSLLINNRNPESEDTSINSPLKIDLHSLLINNRNINEDVPLNNRPSASKNNSPVKIVDINSLLIHNRNPESEDTPLNNSPLKIDLHSLLITNRNIINEDVPLNNSPVKIVDINSLLINNRNIINEDVPLNNRPSSPSKVLDLLLVSIKSHNQNKKKEG